MTRHMFIYIKSDFSDEITSAHIYDILSWLLLVNVVASIISLSELVAENHEEAQSPFNAQDINVIWQS